MNKIKIDRDHIREGGSTVGKISGQLIRDSSGKTIAKIDKDQIKDASGHTIGKLSGECLKDSSGHTLIKMNDIRKSIEGGTGGTTLAAIWLLFVR